MGDENAELVPAPGDPGYDEYAYSRHPLQAGSGPDGHSCLSPAAADREVAVVLTRFVDPVGDLHRRPR